MDKKYFKGNEASNIIGVTQQTLRNWARDGKIDYITTPKGTRMYNVLDYQVRNGIITKDVLERNKNENKKYVCYCRVSTHEQKDDLARQVEYMRAKYPEHEVITDIGSGINFNRKGFLKLIDYAFEGTLSRVVVSYKDRLCRIGYPLVEYIFAKYSGADVYVDGQTSEEDVNVEIAKDVLEIITVYSAKIHGMRRYNKDL